MGIRGWGSVLRRLFRALSHRALPSPLWDAESGLEDEVWAELSDRPD